MNVSLTIWEIIRILEEKSIKFLSFIAANVSRNHVFHITFPKEWKTNDIMQLFSPYGKFFLPEKIARIFHF